MYRRILLHFYTCLLVTQVYENVRSVYFLHMVLADGFFVKEKVFIKSSVADLGSGAFLTPGSVMDIRISDSGF